jgi:hypothetical protein
VEFDLHLAIYSFVLAGDTVSEKQSGALSPGSCSRWQLHIARRLIDIVDSSLDHDS